MPTNKPFYITTAIDYSSGNPHIGHAMEKLVADITIRWHKLNGESTFFLTGTDEHGQKIMRKAQGAGEDPVAFATRISEKFVEMDQLLGVKYDRFIRTTDADHIELAQEIWRRCLEKGDIYKKKYGGWYCVGCEAFKTEKDLIDGKCPDHQTEPEWIEDENYFFRQSKYADQIADKIKFDKLELIPHIRQNELLKFIEQGVEDISISRSRERLSWGIPVPDDDEQVMYVWFDALNNYLTGSGWLKKLATTRWPADIHVIGRDILRHHALLWPAMLISAGIDLPRKIVSHGMITVDGVKMSKSIGNVVAPQDLVTKYGRDASRYIMISEIRFLDDGDFSWERGDVRYAELANNLGNLLSRVLTLASKLTIDNEKSKIGNKEAQDLVEKVWQQFKLALPEFRFRDAISEINQALDWANKFIQDKKPWEVIKNNPEQAWEVIAICYELLRQVMWMITPFMPEIARQISEQLGVFWSEALSERELEKEIEWRAGEMGDFQKGDILFPRLEGEG